MLYAILIFKFKPHNDKDKSYGSSKDGVCLGHRDKIHGQVTTLSWKQKLPNFQNLLFSIADFLPLKTRAMEINISS